MKLQGKVALATGAARRVGKTIAMALAQRGARLTIHCQKRPAKCNLEMKPRKNNLPRTGNFAEIGKNAGSEASG